MDVLALSNLLQDPDLESNFVEKDDPLDNDKGIGLTPAFFGYNEGDETKFQNNLDCPNATVGSSVPCNNNKEEPPYQLYYKQLVGAEDTHLEYVYTRVYHKSMTVISLVFSLKRTPLLVNLLFNKKDAK